MKNKSKIIRSGKGLAGIKYWAQHYTTRVPRYEVFAYVGKQESTGVYFFQSVKEKTLIGKSFNQLNVNGFIPFCIDYAAIQEFLVKQDEEKNNANL